MDIRTALKGQYHASLAMLHQAIAECPDDLWAAGEPKSAYWTVVYHALYCTDLYLRPDAESFEPWALHRPRDEDGGLGEPFARADVLEYWRLCDDSVDAAVDALDLDASECGFSWYQLPKLDHQLNNLRHLQHHIGVLSDRLRVARGRGLAWGTFG